MLKRLPVAILVLALVSCSSLKANSGHRNLASSLPPPFQDGLVPYAQKILTHVSSSDFDSKECVSYLKNLQTEIALIQPRDAGEEMASHASELIDTLWKIRLAIHHRLPEFSADCVNEVRNTARLFRFIEEYLAERNNKVTDLDPDKMDFSKQETPVLVDSPNYLTLQNPDMGKFEFKNGDIMLARGTSFMSAIISRVGDISSQFSHVILVHVDKDTHKVETIESYVGLGVGIYDIETALKNENARLLLIRARDPELASKAADFMYNKAKAAIAAGHPIPYDYKFDFVDHSAVSCAEVALWAYQDASGGKVMLPQYPSRISENPTFLDRIGMSPGDTFTPGDLEVDSRFEMVMEWRDLRLTRDARVKDAIMTSMLNWVDQDGYQLRDTGTSRFAGAFIWRARKHFIWPLVQKILKIQDFSKDIPRNLFQTVVLLNQVGEIFLSHTNSADAAFETQTAWPMTYQDLYQSLEDYRVEDLALYQNKKTRKKSEFGFAFHP